MGPLNGSGEQSMINKVKKIKTLKVVYLQTWPRFLVVGSSDDESLRKLFPFTIQKWLEDLAGEPKSLKS